MSKKIKDFHTCDNFFRTIVQAHIIAFCMHYQGFIKIDDLQTWLSKDNWTDIIAQVKKQYLGLDKVYDIRKKKEPGIFAEVAVKLDTRK